MILENKLGITDSVQLARISVDDISTKELEEYLATGKSLSYCGGISITDAKFVHLKEGRMSTAIGMTLEYAKEMMSSLNEKITHEFIQIKVLQAKMISF